MDAGAFTFLGFLPHKKGRQTALKRLSASEIPVILYESPHRIEKLLSELGELAVSRITIARELTKMHEEVLSGTPAEIQAHFAAHSDTVRGEFVVIVAP
jgi:16S rRNA (cytidine1402-2'-O)-methyltransferase